jgi:hypothetical protein
MPTPKLQQADAGSYLAWLQAFGFQRGVTAAGAQVRERTAILAMDSNTDGLINEFEEEHDECGQSFGIEQFLDLGNQFIERATLIGNAVGNVESESILQGLGSVVNVSGFSLPHTGSSAQLIPARNPVSPPFPGRYREFGH